MSDIQQNYDQPIINPVAKQPLFGSPEHEDMIYSLGGG